MGAVLADPTRDLYESIRSIVNRAPEVDKLREALITSLAYDMPKGRDMFGAAFHNPYTQNNAAMPDGADASTLYTRPYPSMTAGSTVAVTYGAEDTHDVYVLLARKYKNPAKPELGLKDELIMVGGYMEAHAPLGSGTTRPSDNNLCATALRELKEETGLTLPASYQPKSLGADSSYGVSNNPKTHTVNEYFHVNMTGNSGNIPKLTPKDDVAELVWVNAKDIEYHPETPKQKFGSSISRYHANVMVNGQKKHINIRDDHGEMLDKAVTLARQQLVADRQRALGLQEPPAAIPSSALGPQADALHREQIAALGRLHGQQVPSAGWRARLEAERAMAIGNAMAPVPAGRMH
jgi:8-oxo-dGTP pyrophosphatase MutT (NUDIX family)